MNYELRIKKYFIPLHIEQQTIDFTTHGRKDPKDKETEEDKNTPGRHY
jgi:hypothetical protein